MTKQLDDILNYKTVLKNTPEYIRDKLSVTLKKSKKGVGLFSTKPIKKGQVIAYYKMKVFNDKNYKSETDCMYCFSIYSKNDNYSNTFIGDIDIESNPLPKRSIPYWAYFSNEPSVNETGNANIYINTTENYKNRKKLKEGDFVVYKLKAITDINPNQEILWYYGGLYDRNYKVNSE